MLGKIESKVRVMDYPVLAGGSLPVPEVESPADLVARVRELEAKLADQERQFSRQIETVRSQALEQGRELAGGENAAWHTQRTQELTAAIGEFQKRQEEYLSRVEHEVVRLALAIAERILHRESQMDTLLLSGAVRIALGQLADSTEVRLRVPASQQEIWSEMLRLMPGLPVRPEVLADETMETGEAVLEADLGSVDLGIRAQLAEIEQGFFDLLEVRRETTRSGARPTEPAAAGRG